MMQNSLIFIPDISGFTEFVNSTEIDHSRHITTELLEIIIASNQTGLKVSEIEGDAVLFYRDTVPSTREIIDQCQRTFLDFHAHVRRYESERICRCGACRAAVSLSLKFIIHQGEVDLIRVGNHQKLHGQAVILAHKLLKNNISSKEYILFSEKPRPNENHPLTFATGQSKYNALGTIDYHYAEIGQWHSGVKQPDPISIPGLGPNKIHLTEVIEAPVDEIYENFTNLDKRVEWNKEIQEIILKDTGINKAGAYHTCLVGGNDLEFQSIGRFENENQIIYGERLEKFRGLEDILSIYTFESRENKTFITLEIDYRVTSWLGRIIKPLIRSMLMKQSKIGLRKLKSICEKV